MGRFSDNNKVSNEEIEALVDEFAQKMEILRVRYEQYFVGVEKCAPMTLRMDVARIMRELEQLNVRNTALKFKIRTNIQKFTSYSTYWNRTLREIEDGTYKRHVDRAKRHQAAAELSSKTETANHNIAGKASDPVKTAAVADEAEAFLASLGMGTPAKTESVPEKPAIVQPAAAKPAIIQPAAAKPAIVRPNVKPAIIQPAAAKPAIIQPAAAKPAIIQPAAKPAIVQPAAAKPAIVQPAAAKPAIIQPAAKPAIIQPAAKPAIIQPAAKPAIIQPAAKPAIIQPAAAKPAIIQPAAKPAIVQPPKPAIVRPSFLKPAITPGIKSPASDKDDKK